MHDAALGWVAFTIIASIYHMLPRLYGREIYSKKIIEAQFWIMTIGIVFYFSSMWIAGIVQGMMWRDITPLGQLKYSFIDTVMVLKPYFVMRGIGGILYLVGFIMFIYNVIMTMVSARELQKEPEYASPMAS